jgi:hypothetical protein
VIIMDSKMLTATTFFWCRDIGSSNCNEWSINFYNHTQNAIAHLSDATTTNNMTHTMIEPRDMSIIMRGEKNVSSSINLMNIMSNAIESQVKVSPSVMPPQQQQQQRLQLVIIHTHVVAAHLGDVNGY